MRRSAAGPAAPLLASSGEGVTSEDPVPQRTNPMRQRCRRVFCNRRFPAALVVGGVCWALLLALPPTYTKVGHFGVRADMLKGRAFSVEVPSGETMVVVSSFLSLMPGALVHTVLLGAYEVTGGDVMASPAMYDAEGFLLRTGPSHRLTSSSRAGVVKWTGLHLEEHFHTANGTNGRGQTFFLGVVLTCAKGQAANVTMPAGDKEMYALKSSLAPRLAVHMVIPGKHADAPSRLDYNEWEKVKLELKKSWTAPPGSPPPTSAGFLAVQAQWSIDRPAWKALYVAGTTLYSIILIFDGLPACFAFAGLLVAFLMAGILKVQDAVGGFAQEGILTVAIFLVVARALDDISYVQETIVWLIGRPTSLRRAHLQMMVPVVFMSGIIPNTAIIAMMVPILNRWAMRLGIPPSQLMMPLAFASLLGSNLTLIGSGANLIAASVFSSIQVHMFDLTPKGLIIAVVGVVYMTFAAPLLLPFDESADGATQSSPVGSLAPSPLTPVHDGGNSPRRRRLGDKQGVEAPFALEGAEADDMFGDVFAAQEQTPATSMREVPVAFRLDFSGRGHGCFQAPRPTFQLLLDGDEEVAPTREGAADVHVSEHGSMLRQGSGDPFSASRTDLCRLGNPEHVHLAKARLYTTKFYVEAKGAFCGSDIESTGLQKVEGVNLFQICDRSGKVLHRQGRDRAKGIIFTGGEQLYFRVTPAGYHNLRLFRGLRPAPGIAEWLEKMRSGRRKRILVEAVVQDTTSPLFKGCGELDAEEILENLWAVVVAVRRGAAAKLSEEDPVVRGADSCDGIKISPGDVLLLDAREKGHHIEARDEFLLVRSIRDTHPPRAGAFGDKFRACLGITLLLGLVILTAIPALQVNTLVGAWFVACLYVFFDLLNFDQVLLTLEVRLPALLTLMLAIGVGEAFKKSGLVDVLSGGVLWLADLTSGIVGSPSAGISFAVFLVVCNFAAFVNMGSAVAVMAPVVQQIVVDLPGVELKPIAHILMYAANSPFATPFGASANLMVVSAGNYTFMDFFRFGAPLQLLVLITAVAADQIFANVGDLSFMTP